MVGQRAVAVELDQHVVELAVHQVAGQPPDAQGGGAMGTRRPAHHGPMTSLKMLTIMVALFAGLA